jgi:putative ABC transport system substrate-binding protein
MRRHAFIAGLGGAAAMWPISVCVQQTKLPTIGFLGARSPATDGENVAAFRKGLSEAGYVEKQNVSVEYRWVEGLYNRLPTLASELVNSQVAVIVANGGVATALGAMREIG